MTSEKLHTKELFASLDEITSEFLQLVASLDENEINAIPFKDSWTAAQVAEHVTKSNISIIHSLKVKGKPSERTPDERAEELKDLFLDFSTKLKSPDFILPTRDIYEKQMLVINLKDSIDEIKQLRKKVNLAETLNHPAFGDITKLEILHFVVYHTQRHTHQLSKISQSVKNKNEKKSSYMTTQIHAYVGFNGNCREAMNFYKECLEGELALQTVAGSPIENQFPPAMEDQILHSSLMRKGTLLLMGTDCTAPGGFIPGNNIALSLNCSSEEEINTFFSKLSEGGKIIDTLKQQFWGAMFGVFDDKFGARWMLSYDKNQQQ